MTNISTIHFAQGIGAAQRIAVPFGLTVREIALEFHGKIEGLTAWLRAPAGHATEWIEVPAAMWGRIKPKVSDCVMFGYRPGKSVWRTVVSVVATIVLAVIAPVLAGALGSTLLGAAATAAIGIGASLAINALFPVESASQNLGGAASPNEQARSFKNVDSDSNVLAKEAYLPVIAGIRRISPPEIASPIYSLEGGVQTISRIFALDGHHSLTEVQVDGAPVSDFSSITTETRDGAEASPVTTFIKKVSNTVAVSEQLSSYSADGVVIVDQETPENSEPRWVRFTTISDPKLEEILIRVQTESFLKTDSATAKIRIPLRIRFRPKGSSGAWNNLPEVHIVGRDISSSLKEFRFRWDSSFGAADTAGDLTFDFFQQVPATAFVLSDGSTGIQWQAHSHFVDGAGITATRNISGKRNGLRVILNEVDFPKVAYEWEIIRGEATVLGSLTVATYQIGGAVNSLFVSKNVGSTWRITTDQGALIGRVSVIQATCIINREPCQRPGTALLAMKSKGQSVKNVTALAGRYVLDWDGASWSALTTSKNPAVQYRQILFDYLQYQGIDTGLIDDSSLVAWRAECIARGYEMSAVFSGASVKDALEQAATAGYARPRYSDGFGVDFFRDRSSERPVQSFSPRNATINLEWITGEKPIGIRAKFQNEDDGYKDDELQVNNPFYSNFSGYDVREYQSITKPDLIRRRAYFDMLQAYYQGRRAITVDTSIEGTICERGDLISVVTDLLNDANSGTRIRNVIDTTNFTIDQRIPAESTESIFDVGNIFEPGNIFSVGEQSVCLISTPTGSVMRTIVAAEGDVIRIDEELPTTDLAGAHIVLGPVSRFTNRCIVSDIKRTGEERATLILVDEAPEIWSAMSERFDL